MQSFDTKGSSTVESFDRKFERFDTFSTKDSEIKQSGNDFVERFDRKFKGFDVFSTKDSEVEQSDIRVAESFDRKVDINDEKALPDSKSFDTKDSNVSIPNFDNSSVNSDDNEQCVSSVSQPEWC